MPHLLRSAPSGAPSHPHRTVQLIGFRAVSRRTLAIATVVLSMFLVVVHDLPASAATAAPEPEVVVDVQQVSLTQATVAASEAASPISEVRDGFTITTFTQVQWPLDPSTPISSYFGNRAAACAGCSTNHHGIDWTPAYGTPVQAIADGVVISLPLSDLGTYVVIQHNIDGEIVNSVYAHLVRGSGVAVGSTVSRGQVIGLSGNTGITSGPHLHFGILHGFDAVEPLGWMRTHVTQAWGT